MKRSMGVTVLAAVVALFAANDASAQVSVFVGGGATIPVSDYGDFANTGWMGFAGLLYPIGESGLAVGAEGFYGSNNHDTDGDKTNLSGGNALVGYTFHAPEEIGGFVFGGLGYLNHSFKSESLPAAEGSSSGLSAGVGAGLDIPLGSVGGSIGGNYNLGFGDVDGTDFIAIWASIQIAVGG